MQYLPAVFRKIVNADWTRLPFILLSATIGCLDP